jgi:hypothetical protein
MKKKLIIPFIFCCFAAFGQGRIDGFYKGKQQGAVVLGVGFEDSKSYFAGTDKLDLGRSLYYVSVFSAYGITENLDANISVPYLVSDDNANFQDISVFLKYRMFQKKTANGSLEISGALGFSTNLTNYDLGGLNDIGQRATVIETRGLLHYGFNTGWFVTLQSGYSFKTGTTPNSLPATLKLGRATAKWYYDLYYDFQHSFGGIDYRGTPRPQDFSAFGVDFHKVGGTLYNTFSESFGAYISLSYVLDGRNVFQGPGYGIGLVYNFSTN